MMKGLSGKSYIVTGGASGIGRATCIKLAEEGANVAVFDQKIEGARATVGMISDNCKVAEAYAIDVSVRDDWSRAYDAAKATFGSIEGLVNNAGVTRDRSLLKMSDEDWNTVIDVNLKGAWLGCQTVVPGMKEVGGAIVNLCSESRWGNFGQSNYSSAKSGLVGLTRTIAIEHARHKIRSNAVAPGTITTPMIEAVPTEVRKDWLPTIPLGREGEPSEVASVVAFLLSDESSYVTGQILGINGGTVI